MKTTSYTESRVYAFDNAPRCGAKTKRNNGEPCRCPAIKGKTRCRVHGGAKGSGAPKGNMNALKHGDTTASAKNFRIKVKRVLHSSKAFLKELEDSIG